MQAASRLRAVGATIEGLSADGEVIVREGLRMLLDQMGIGGGLSDLLLRSLSGSQTLLHRRRATRDPLSATPTWA
jgi:hypothetical protein